MRNYAQEGWATQLQGRRVVGHYLVSTKFDNAAATSAIALNIRNPLNPRAQAQRHMHIIRAYISAACSAKDDALVGAQYQFATANPFTVSSATGGTAIDPVNFLRNGIASVMTGGFDTAGGISGTTLTQEQSFLELSMGQPATTGTDASADGVALWEPTWGPILCVGDQGVVATCAQGPSSPGVFEVFFSIEWLETEKM